MILTREEIGEDQYEKAHNDRGRFKGSPVIARAYAAERGSIAVTHMQSLDRAVKEGDRSHAAMSAFAQDAAMFARMAFRGWRAYRLLKGE